MASNGCCANHFIYVLAFYGVYVLSSIPRACIAIAADARGLLLHVLAL
jgi:hypothetical protein